MGDRNIRVPGLGETMAETRGIYAYTPAACVEQARLAGVYTTEAVARRGEISARIRVARALEHGCANALNVNNNRAGMGRPQHGRCSKSDERHRELIQK